MFKQIAAVTAMNLRSLPQRLGPSAVIVIGIAVTVAVLVSVQAMALGFQRTLGHTGRADRAIVLRGGSEAELNSTMSRENTLTIMDAPGVRKDADGKPLATAEAVAIIALPQKSNDSPANVTVRGIGAKAMQVRPEIHLVAGRMFEPAVREIIVGTSAQAQFKGLELGAHVPFRDSDWTVVGVFDSGGDAHQSELMGDVETVLSAFHHNLFHSVTVLLETPESFGKFKDALTTDPTLTVEPQREPDYYAKQSEQLSKVLNIVAYFVGGIAAIGAMVGALNTMYTTVAARSLEIATLRAIGFGSGSVVASVLIESLLLALLGAAIGAVAAWIFFNGNTVNTLGKNFSQVVFQLSVGPELLVGGVIWACIIGAVGGLFPAIRAARQPVAAALRAG
ncbi:MAG TPA: ABC transporter permease [Nevskia sp.]|nr:ABC transporter permease [Nevskia sp.]